MCSGFRAPKSRAGPETARLRGAGWYSVSASNGLYDTHHCEKWDLYGTEISAIRFEDPVLKVSNSTQEQIL